MTPFTLLHRLGMRNELPEQLNPDAVFREVEQRAQRGPSDLDMRDLVLWAHRWMTAGDGLAPVVCDVRREVLIRMDAWSTTWSGIHVRTAEPCQVRVLRPHLTRDAAMRRTLERDALALTAVLPVQFHGGVPGGLTVSTAAASLADHSEQHGEREAALPGLLATGLGEVLRWNRAGLLPGDLSPSELSDDGSGLTLTCLTPGRGRLPDQVASFARILLDWLGEEPEDGLPSLLLGLHMLPPVDEPELTERVVDAFAEELAAYRHEVWSRCVSSRGRTRSQRLLASVRRLGATVMLPEGLAAVGVGLDGHPTALRRTGQQLEWGPVNGPYQQVFSPETGLDPREARRLVRAYRAAPYNPRLDRSLGGDRRWGEAAVRWVHSALELRTLRLLLESQG